MQKQYNETEFKAAYLSLTEEQKKVLDEHVKRGMKTKWLNIWAKKKGIVLSEEELEDPDKSMDGLLEWVLLDYEDRLTIDPNTRCECGRPLRYRYTILHKLTGIIHHLGTVHFEQHTGLNPEMVRLITKGLKEIDLERTEILSKVLEKWKLPFDIPPEIAVPNDMVEQIRVNLPLLDRQIFRLKELVITFYKNNKFKNDLFSFIPSKRRECQKEESNTFIKNETLPIEAISRIQFNYLYQKLRTKRITASEAKQLYFFVRDHPLVLQNYGFTLQDIKSSSFEALGVIGTSEIRKWLVEIDYMSR